MDPGVGIESILRPARVKANQNSLTPSQVQHAREGFLLLEQSVHEVARLAGA
jgi:hypothetical protein